MKRLLRTKSSIIFFIVFIIPLLAIMIHEQIGRFFLYGFYFIWIISLGLILSKNKREKKFIIINMLIIGCLPISATFVFKYNNSIIYEPYYEKIIPFTFGIFILHLLIGAIAYILILKRISKTVIKLNSNKGDLLLFLFSLIIYPIGIWIVQNSISNAILLVENTKTEKENKHN